MLLQETLWKQNICLGVSYSRGERAYKFHFLMESNKCQEVLFLCMYNFADQNSILQASLIC